MADNESLRASLSRALVENNMLLGGVQDIDGTPPLQIESSLFVNMPDLDSSLFMFDDHESSAICDTLQGSDPSSMNLAI